MVEIEVEWNFWVRVGAKVGTLITYFSLLEM